MSVKRSAQPKKNVTIITAGRSGDPEETDAKTILLTIQKDLEDLHRQIDRVEEMLAHFSENAAPKGAGR